VNYTVKGVDKQGCETEIIVDAESDKEAAKTAKEKGVFPTSINTSKQSIVNIKNTDTPNKRKSPKIALTLFVAITLITTISFYIYTHAHRNNPLPTSNYDHKKTENANVGIQGDWEEFFYQIKNSSNEWSERNSKLIVQHSAISPWRKDKLRISVIWGVENTNIDQTQFGWENKCIRDGNGYIYSPSTGPTKDFSEMPNLQPLEQATGFRSTYIVPKTTNTKSLHWGLYHKGTTLNDLKYKIKLNPTQNDSSFLHGTWEVDTDLTESLPENQSYNKEKLSQYAWLFGIQMKYSMAFHPDGRFDTHSAGNSGSFFYDIISWKDNTFMMLWQIETEQNLREHAEKELFDPKKSEWMIIDAEKIARHQNSPDGKVWLVFRKIAD